MKRVGRMTAVVVLAVGGLTVGASPAQATNYGCFDERDSGLTAHKVTCDLSWPTQVYAKAWCWPVAGGSMKQVNGATVGPARGQRNFYTAWAFCPSGYEVDGGSYTILN